MNVQFFPNDEYHLISKYQTSEATHVFCQSVMGKQYMAFDFVNYLADKQMGIYRYFEGEINDNHFTIRHKQYWPVGILRPVIPVIKGTILENGNGTMVYINTESPNLIFLILAMSFLFLFGMLFSQGQFPINMLFLLFLSLILLFKRARYIRRMGKDKEQLKLIFKAEETEQQ